MTSSIMTDRIAEIRRMHDAADEAHKAIEHLRLMATHYDQANQPNKAKRVRVQIRVLEAITR